GYEQPALYCFEDADKGLHDRGGRRPAGTLPEAHPVGHDRRRRDLETTLPASRQQHIANILPVTQQPSTASILAHTNAGVARFEAKSAIFEGEGDFCRAYTVNEKWIFRFAKNAEGSRSLEREVRLLPKLAPA